MTDLINSQRRIHKSTYVEIRADAKDKAEGKTAMIRRPHEKLNFLRSLQPTDEEVTRIEALLHSEPTQHSQSHRAALLALTATLRGSSGANGPPSASAIAPLDHEVLVSLGRLLASVRRAMSAEAEQTLDQLRTTYAHYLEAAAFHTVAALPSDDPPAYQTDPRFGSRPHPAHAPNANVGYADPLHLGGSSSSAVDGKIGSRRSRDEQSPAQSSGVSTVRWPSLAASYDWALDRADPVVLALADRARLLLKHLPSTPTHSSETLVAALTKGLRRMGDQADEAVDAFIDQFQIEPVGRLHLERMEMTPVGVERGELVYSIPLSPQETVNISHKEWSVQSEEFETLVLDVQEEYSEKGVTDKTDLSQSTESQRHHATAYSLSGTYSGYGASVSVGYNSSSEDQQAQNDSRQQSIALTRKASSRAKQEHKHSFNVTSVIGSEDQSVRVITNPRETESMRIDYYQLVRKWRVDLYRYDLRMTYDIVVPSPGADLLQQLDELWALDALIDAPFAFALVPSAIDRETWSELAAQWGAEVDFPPSDDAELFLHHEATSECGGRGVMESLDFRVDADYEIQSAAFLCHYATCGDLDDYHFGIVGDVGHHNDHRDMFTSPLSTLVGMSGDLAVSYSHRNISHFAIRLTVELKLTGEAFQRWQHRAWNAIRSAAEEAFYAGRQLSVDRRVCLG